MPSEPLMLLAVAGFFVLVGALVVALLRKGRSETEARAYLLGVNYVLSDDPDAAIEELSRVAQLGPQTLETYFALGALFRRKGDVDRALRLHQNMLLRPNLPPEVRRRAQLAVATDFRRAGLTGRAVETLKKLLSEAPDHREAAAALRRLYEETGDWEEAAALQARWAELDGEAGNAILAHHLAALSRTRGKEAPAEAQALADRACALSPRSADALLAQAEARLAAGDRAAASDAARQAFALEPELVLRQLEVLVAALGLEEAEQALGQWAEAAGPEGAPYALAAALCQKRRGNLEGAVDRLQRLVDASPRFREARTALGAMLLELDRSDELRADYAEMLGSWGKPPLGFVCRQCGQSLVEHSFRCPQCGAWDAVARESNPSSGQ